MIVGESAGPVAFELLVVGQDIDPTWDLSYVVLELKGTLADKFARVPVSLFVEDTGQALGLAAAPPSVKVDRSKLTQYLTAAALPVPGLTKPLERWAPDGSAGAHDALVVLLLGAPAQSSVSKADSLSLDRSDGLPAMVAIQVGVEPHVPGAGSPPFGRLETYGHLWHLPIVRAVAQLRFNLLDEHELPGSDFTRPPADWVSGFNNVVFLSGTQRAALQGMSPPQTRALLGDAVRDWPLDDGDALDFTPHAGPDSQVSTAGPLATAADPEPAQTLALYEGAAGYRTFAVRGAADCLMRRMPGSSTLPIQDDVDFCPVCKHLIATAVEKGEARRLARPTLISNQRLEFERLPWPGAPQRLVGAAVKAFSVTEAAAAGRPPHWGATVRVAVPAAAGALAGLVAEDITLTDRDDDPFVNSDRVFKRISFGDLSVSFAGQAAPQALDVGDALNATGDLSPELLVQRDSGSFQAQLGYRLTLRWELANGWRVEAAMSLVLKRSASTIDPGSAVVGCKAFPQLKLRALRAPGHSGELPRVTALSGTVRLRVNNAIEMADHQAMEDAGMNDPSGGMMTDAIEAFLFTDGNAVHSDAVYSLVALPGVPVAVLPADVVRRLPAASMEWVAFRRLAAVQAYLVEAPAAAPLAGAATFAYRRHANAGNPILPLWSWLFDYAELDCVVNGGDTVTFTGVWAIGETTPAVGAKPGRAASDGAEVLLDWPPPIDFPELAGPPVKQPVLRHRRLPREGTWDNLHCTPPMGFDALGRKTVSAPVCADKCFHLHWRWGSDGIVAPADAVKEPERYMGWTHVGPWRSNSLLGAPLIPPNQHLEVTLTRVGDGEVEIAYATRARDPGDGHWQVSLEQGAGFAYNYQGLASSDFKLLARALLGEPFPADDPATRRKTFITQVYPRLRWFAGPNDGATSATIQQIPNRADLPAAKWTELRDA